MRLFIATDFGELKDFFCNIQSQFPDAKLKLTKTFHLTFKFLGDIQPDIVEKVKRQLSKIKFSHFSVALDSIGIFPNENYIRVVWIGVSPDKQAIDLQNKIDDSLNDLFKRESSFKPHITLARVKSVDDKKDFVRKLSEIGIENRKIEVKNFKLIQSILTPQGPVYKDLAVFNLT